MFNPDKYQQFLHKIVEIERQINSITKAIDNLTSEKDMLVDIVVHKWNKENQSIRVYNEDILGMLQRLLEYYREELRKSQEIIRVLDLLLKGNE